VSPWSKKGKCAESPLPVPSHPTAARSSSHCQRLRHQWPNFSFSPFIFTGPQLSPTRPRNLHGGLRAHRPGDSARTPRLVLHHARHRRLESVLAAPRSRRCGLFGTSGWTEERRAVVLVLGSDRTRHVVDAGFLRKIKRKMKNLKHAVLMNTSRGTLRVVDSDAPRTNGGSGILGRRRRLLRCRRGRTAHRRRQSPRDGAQVRDKPFWEKKDIRRQSWKQERPARFQRGTQSNLIGVNGTGKSSLCGLCQCTCVA
jgi:hypothetical protein